MKMEYIDPKTSSLLIQCLQPTLWAGSNGNNAPDPESAPTRGTGKAQVF